MDGNDLYDDDVPSTTAGKAERWTNMSTSERNEERMQRKKERNSKKKSKKSNDDTVIEEFEYNWDDDEEDENETAGQYPDNNIGQDATGPEEDDGVFDDPEFMKTAVKEHARYLGMDPSDKDHAELMWIAEEALTAPLPDDWEQGVTDDGTPYFYNVKTKESVWDHPLDAHYQKLFKVELKKLKKEKKMKKVFSSRRRSIIINNNNGENVKNRLLHMKRWSLV